MEVLTLLSLGAESQGEELRVLKVGNTYMSTILELLVGRTWDHKDKAQSLSRYHTACMVMWKVTGRLPVRTLDFMHVVITMPVVAKLKTGTDPYSAMAERGDRPAYAHSKTCSKCKLLGYPPETCPSCFPSLDGAQAAAVVRAFHMRR
jgi:hypothetical protein